MGGSHSGNLSAEEAVKAGAADILVSDYYPQALLHAVFELWKKQVLTLPGAVKLATLNPAKATGIDSERGSLADGKYADILVIDCERERPFIEKVFVNGTKVVDCRRMSENE